MPAQDIVRNEVRQAIGPQVVALAVFGAIAALAMLVLAGAGPRAADEPVGPGRLWSLRALGGSRAQTALAASLPGAGRVAGATVLAVAGAIAISPLAPVGQVRQFDPARGIQADALVLGGGAALLAAILLAAAGRDGGPGHPAGHPPGPRAAPSAVAHAAGGGRASTRRCGRGQPQRAGAGVGDGRPSRSGPPCSGPSPR